MPLAALASVPLVFLPIKTQKHRVRGCQELSSFSKRDNPQQHSRSATLRLSEPSRREILHHPQITGAGASQPPGEGTFQQRCRQLRGPAGKLSPSLSLCDCSLIPCSCDFVLCFVSLNPTFFGIIKKTRLQCNKSIKTLYEFISAHNLGIITSLLWKRHLCIIQRSQKGLKAPDLPVLPQK